MDYKLLDFHAIDGNTHLVATLHYVEAMYHHQFRLAFSMPFIEHTVNVFDQVIDFIKKVISDDDNDVHENVFVYIMRFSMLMSCFKVIIDNVDYLKLDLVMKSYDEERGNSNIYKVINKLYSDMATKHIERIDQVLLVDQDLFPFKRTPDTMVIMSVNDALEHWKYRDLYNSFEKGIKITDHQEVLFKNADEVMSTKLANAVREQKAISDQHNNNELIKRLKKNKGKKRRVNLFTRDSIYEFMDSHKCEYTCCSNPLICSCTCKSCSHVKRGMRLNTHYYENLISYDTGFQIKYDGVTNISIDFQSRIIVSNANVVYLGHSMTREHKYRNFKERGFKDSFFLENDYTSNRLNFQIGFPSEIDSEASSYLEHRIMIIFKLVGVDYKYAFEFSGYSFSEYRTNKTIVKIRSHQLKLEN